MDSHQTWMVSAEPDRGHGKTKFLNSGKVTRQGTWLEVSHYWQVMIDEAQINMKQCHTYLHCTQVTHQFIKDHSLVPLLLFNTFNTFSLNLIMCYQNGLPNCTAFVLFSLLFTKIWSNYPSTSTAYLLRQCSLESGSQQLCNGTSFKSVE